LARAALDGLGPAEGSVVTWTVPADLAQARSPFERPFDSAPAPAPASPAASSRAPWLWFVGLLLVVVLVLLRASRKGPLQ
jgi:hypothetical protein